MYIGAIWNAIVDVFTRSGQVSSNIVLTAPGSRKPSFQLSVLYGSARYSMAMSCHGEDR